MRKLAYLLSLVFLSANIAFGQAIAYVPPPSAMFFSTDGTGNPGTWTPASGGGSGAISWVPPATAMYCSTNGTGSAGTWAPCNPTGGGGGGVTAGSVWQREGTIISAPQSEEYNASEPSLLYEGSPQILTSLSGNVFKMWWNCGFLTTGLCYAESPDAEVWTRAASPVIARANPGPAHGQVFHYQSTYYYYTGNSATLSNQINIYTSTNGTTWTLAHSNVLPLGAGGSWDSVQFGNVYIVPGAGTWFMMYEAYGAANSNNVFWLGTATSSDQGVTWVKNGGNPVIKGYANNAEAAGPEVHLIGSTYYVWYTCNNTTAFTPTDICRAHSPDFVTWTPDNSINPTLSRFTPDEGAGVSGGQVADPSMVQVGNTIYMAYDGVYVQNGTSPDSFHLKLATAPYTFAQLIQTNEGSATNFHSAGAFNTLNLFPCVYYDNNTARVPCATSGLFYDGLLLLQGQSGFPEFNWNIYWDGSANRYITNGGAIQTYFDVSSDVYHFFMAPAGTAGGNTNSGFDYYTVSQSAGFTFAAGAAFNGGITANTNPVTINSSLKVASTGTALSRYARYAVALTPAAVGANTCAAQSFTVTGVLSGDFLISVVKPTEQAGLSQDPGHVSAANTATINFCNNTGSSITPTAGETYQFVVVQ